MNLTRPPPIALASLKLGTSSCPAVTVATSKDNSRDVAIAATNFIVVVVIDQLIDGRN